ncbi:MAG: hypothetical protein GF399_12170 [Candidatus Coatesbacteria bacterium]|nr:hypothetical protein [Candidatus Coatesbacteria bacterium]
MKNEKYFDALLNLLRKVRELPLIKRPSGWELDRDVLPDEPGVFCIWWLRGSVLWKDRSVLELKLSSAEAGGEFVPFNVDTEMLDIDTHSPVALYVGKTESIARRLDEHLMLDIKKIPPEQYNKADFSSRYSRFRQVFDQLFPYLSDLTPLVRRYLGYSYVKLPGDDKAYLRYYLKNYAVGSFRSICNLDVFELIA